MNVHLPSGAQAPTAIPRVVERKVVPDDSGPKIVTTVDASRHKKYETGFKLDRQKYYSVQYIPCLGSKVVLGGGSVFGLGGFLAWAAAPPATALPGCLLPGVCLLVEAFHDILSESCVSFS